MDKRWVIIIIGIVSVLLGASYFLFFSAKPAQASQGKVLINPLEGLTDEQAVAQFNESFVLYLPYSINVNTLHNAPFSSENPKIAIEIGGKMFNAYVKNNVIFVSEGSVTGEDIFISTSSGEAVAMLRDKAYISESFKSGKSSFALKASKVTLVAKGYIGIYEELTGKSS